MKVKITLAIKCIFANQLTNEEFFTYGQSSQLHILIRKYYQHYLFLNQMKL